MPNRQAMEVRVAASGTLHPLAPHEYLDYS
jgi:hypothetical protein